MFLAITASCSLAADGVDGQRATGARGALLSAVWGAADAPPNCQSLRYVINRVGGWVPVNTMKSADQVHQTAHPRLSSCRAYGTTNSASRTSHSPEIRQLRATSVFPPDICRSLIACLTATAWPYCMDIMYGGTCILVSSACCTQEHVIMQSSFNLCINEYFQ